MIHEAKEAGMHVILSFTDNWKYHGGVDQFVDWSSTAPPRDIANFSIEGDARVMAAGDVDLNQRSEERRVYESTRKVLFYTDPGAKQLYINHMKTILERTNTITGVCYADDTTIMSFNLINELRCENCSRIQGVHNWITEMARTFKQLDSNHLLTIGGEGFYKSGEKHSKYNPGATEESDWAGETGQDFIGDHTIPDIDYATLHLWAKNWAADAGDDEAVDAFRRDWVNVHVEDAAAVLHKPLVLEEFGMRIIIDSKEGEGKSASSLTLEQQLQQRDAAFQPLLAEIQRHMSHQSEEGEEEKEPSPLAGSLFWKHAFPIYRDSASQDEYGIHPDDATYHLLTEHARWVNSHMNHKVPLVSSNDDDECVDGGRVCWVPTTSWGGLLRTCGQENCVREGRGGVFSSKEMCCRAGLGGWGSAGCGMSWFF